ncbi:MAG: hypothetical protein Tsb002_25370 [Wenzhouxiangellaceae bacterium]
MKSKKAKIFVTTLLLAPPITTAYLYAERPNIPCELTDGRTWTIDSPENSRGHSPLTKGSTFKLERDPISGAVNFVSHDGLEYWNGKMDFDQDETKSKTDCVFTRQVTHSDGCVHLLAINVSSNFPEEIAAPATHNGYVKLNVRHMIGNYGECAEHERKNPHQKSGPDHLGVAHGHAP